MSLIYSCLNVERLNILCDEEYDHFLLRFAHDICLPRHGMLKLHLSLSCEDYTNGKIIAKLHPKIESSPCHVLSEVYHSSSGLFEVSLVGSVYILHIQFIKIFQVNSSTRSVYFTGRFPFALFRATRERSEDVVSSEGSLEEQAPVSVATTPSPDRVESAQRILSLSAQVSRDNTSPSGA